MVMVIETYLESRDPHPTLLMDDCGVSIERSRTRRKSGDEKGKKFLTRVCFLCFAENIVLPDLVKNFGWWGPP